MSTTERRFWELYEKSLSRRYAKHPTIKGIPLPEKATLQPNDVSIVIATIDTPKVFTECLASFLTNNPLEIVIVTIPKDEGHVMRLVNAVDDPEGKITVLTVDKANKRGQMVRGIQQVSGKVIALVDDDTTWPQTTVLPYLLAGFEDKRVGGASGSQ